MPVQILMKTVNNIQTARDAVNRIGHIPLQRRHLHLAICIVCNAKNATN
jgi:hypothetical protein